MQCDKEEVETLGKQGSVTFSVLRIYNIPCLIWSKPQYVLSEKWVSYHVSSNLVYYYMV